jgi:hypothetical protein
MIPLTADETTRWLQLHGQAEDPHSHPEANDQVNSPFHGERYAPPAYGTIESFTDRWLTEIVPSGDVLFQLVEWDVWCEPRGYIVKKLLPMFDEAVPFKKMGGFLLEPSERHVATALFSLSTSFMWKSYLYGETERTTLFNWEGEILDVWTSSDARFQLIEHLLDEFQLRRV